MHDLLKLSLYTKMNNSDLSKAYAYIRERIINGSFPGNFSLKPDVLCKKIGMSRTPVRDALRQLEAEGLVVILPRMGAKVRAIDADEYSAISGLRMALEVYAAGLAANIRTDADLLSITVAHQAHVAETERLISKSDLTTYKFESLMSDVLQREDINFHLAITSAAKNYRIKQAVLQQSLISRIVSASSSFLHDPFLPVKHDELVAYRRATCSEHAIILDAIKIRDSNLAKTAMEGHLQQDFSSVLRRLSRNEQDLSANDLHFPYRSMSNSRRG